MKVATTIRQAVRLHCLDCNGETRVTSENDCVGRDCFLYPFRPWDGPGKKKSRNISDEQKKHLSKLAKKRASK